MLDCDMRYLQVSDRWCADYSVDCAQVLGRSHYELFPDVPEHWKEMHQRALKGETLRAEEDRWERGDGSVKWVQWEIRPWMTPSGVVGGILIFAEDITHRKLLEQTNLDIGQRLITSQEQERVRISRELHDDIGQRLSLLATELEQLQQDRSLHVQVAGRLVELQKQTSELVTDVQSLSHELHSSKLEYLGMVVAMRSFCKEFGEHHRMQINFHSHDVPGSMPPDISLCLFRVLQEALHNSAKHSRAKHVEVRLWGTSGEVNLTVRDSGVGFEDAAAKKSRGLGLISMQERLKLVKGQFSIESHPSCGTTIHAQVPWPGNEILRMTG